MRSKSANLNLCSNIFLFISIISSSTFDTSKADAASPEYPHVLRNSTLNNLEPKSTNNSDLLLTERLISSKLLVLPETSNLVKEFEGFRSSAYIDSSGLPVIGYGQTRINGRTVKLGQYISQAQANVALEQELYQIQKLVKAHVKVKLNPYQLGALTSLVYNAGTIVIKDSTLIRKLNTGDYVGASKEFVRWNKANRGGKLVEFPGLTRRRLAEQKLFLKTYDQLATN